eukprot:693387-Hanusia_phi.AAC.1
MAADAAQCPSVAVAVRGGDSEFRSSIRDPARELFKFRRARAILAGRYLRGPAGLSRPGTVLLESRHCESGPAQPEGRAAHAAAGARRRALGFKYSTVLLAVTPLMTH